MESESRVSGGSDEKEAHCAIAHRGNEIKQILKSDVQETN